MYRADVFVDVVGYIYSLRPLTVVVLPYNIRAVCGGVNYRTIYYLRCAGMLRMFVLILVQYYIGM